MCGGGIGILSPVEGLRSAGGGAGPNSGVRVEGGMGGGGREPDLKNDKIIEQFTCIFLYILTWGAEWVLDIEYSVFRVGAHKFHRLLH